MFGQRGSLVLRHVDIAKYMAEMLGVHLSRVYNVPLCMYNWDRLVCQGKVGDNVRVMYMKS